VADRDELSTKDESKCVLLVIGLADVPERGKKQLRRGRSLTTESSMNAPVRSGVGVLDSGPWGLLPDAVPPKLR
jgi:hypothetical protein